MTKPTKLYAWKRNNYNSAYPATVYTTSKTVSSGDMLYSNTGSMLSYSISSINTNGSFEIALETDVPVEGGGGSN